MAAIGWFIVPFCAALVGLSVALIAPVAISGVERTIRTARIRSQLANPDNAKSPYSSRSGSGSDSGDSDLLQQLLEDFCRNGIRFLRPVARIMLRSKLLQQRIDVIAMALGSRIEGVCSEAVLESLVAASVVLALVVNLVAAQLVLALASMLVPILFCSMRAKRWKNRQQELLREQLPDALRALGMCFQAGFSLQQALEQTALETAQPLQTELFRTTHDMQTGSSVFEALVNLEQRTKLPDLQFVTIAMEIQHTTGGSLREILDSAADSINSVFELNRSMQVQTAQAKMSARVVSVMPIILMMVLSVAMEGYLETFFSSIPGFMLLITALGMELVGVMAIRKILGLNLD